LLARFRLWFYQALEPLAPARLMTRTDSSTGATTSGDLLSRFVTDIETLQELYVRAISPPIVALIIGIILWLILGAYNAAFALTLLAFFLLAGIGIPVFIHLISRRLERRIVLVRAAFNTALVDSIQGIADLLAFDQADAQRERVEQLNRQMVRLQAMRALISGLREMLDILLTDGCVWIMLLIAIPLVRSGQLNGVYLALIVLAALSSFEAVRPLANAAQLFGGCIEAARRLFDVMDQQPAVCDPEVAASLPTTYNLAVRLAIARAMLKDAPILIMDEPTAHLDASTEEGVLRSLRTFMQGRTTILITHRLVGLDMANEILVMQDGRIRERGMHDELLQAEGLYWKLWMMQKQVLTSEML
jgi:ATP-binding cassette subfamily C protein CydC